MDDVARRAELKAFLRTRREALRPDGLSLVPGQRRRTPGLRREELASAAGVGVTWYTWLEQGREIRVSVDAIRRIAHALQLKPTDEAYLLRLAGFDSPGSQHELLDLDGYAQLIIKCIDSSPAFVLDPRSEVVAFNRLADRIYSFDPRGWPLGRNHAWRFFADPSRKSLYGDSWDRVATSCVGILRANYAPRVGDPGFEEVLQALRDTGDEFARRWAAHYTAPLSQTLPLTLSHEELGQLAVHSTRLALPDRPDCSLFILPPADERTAAAFSHFVLPSQDARKGTGRTPKRSKASKRR